MKPFRSPTRQAELLQLQYSAVLTFRSMPLSGRSGTRLASQAGRPAANHERNNRTAETQQRSGGQIARIAVHATGGRFCDTEDAVASSFPLPRSRLQGSPIARTSGCDGV